MKKCGRNIAVSISRRISALLFALIVCFTALMLPASAEPSTEDCYAFALYELGTGTLLLDKNYDGQIRPGSTVKLMTGLLACESFVGRYEEELTVTGDMLVYSEGRSAGLFVGQRLTYGELIRLALSGGFNDAANAIAVLISGSVDGFVQGMNERARKLGMTDTVYRNATGIDADGMYTTLRDTVTLAAAVSEVEGFLEYSSSATLSWELSDGTRKTAKNPNLILSDRSEYYCRSASGLNAGYTDGAGYCAVTYATHGGATYICAVMKGYSDGGRFALVQDALQWAYDGYTMRELMPAGSVVGSVKTELAENLSEVELELMDAPSVLEAVGAAYGEYTLSCKFDFDVLTAPVKHGERVGYLTVWDGERLVCTVGITVADDVDRSTVLAVIENMKALLLGRAVRAAAVAGAILLLAAFVIPRIALAVRQRKRRYVKHRDGFKL